MPNWSNIEIRDLKDPKQFNIELNRRIAYYLRNIDVSQILFNLNDIAGTLLLSKGGTGTSLTAPTSNALYGYDISSAKSAFYGVGVGLALSGTTLYNTIFGGSATALFYKITASTANLGDISSTNLITANRIVSSSGQFQTLGSSSGTFADISSTNLITSNRIVSSSGVFQTIGSSSATLADISSTDLITANRIVSSSGQFQVLGSSSATIGQLGSTGSIEANTLTASSATFTKVRSSSAIFGNTTSYTKFEDNGFMEFTDGSRVWKDELADITKLKVVGVGITDDSTENTVDFLVSAATNDYLYCNIQLNHGRDLSYYVYPHLHLFQSSSNVANMLIQHRWQVRGDTKKLVWTSLKMNTPETTYVSGTTIHQIFETSSGIAVPAGTTVSDILQFRIIRDVTNNTGLFSATDNYPVSLKVISFDVHCVVNTLGSRLEGNK